MRVMNAATTRIGTLAGEAIDLFNAAVQQTPPESWDRPSNMAGWSLRELAGHATGSAAKIVAHLEGGEVSRVPSEPADWVCADPAARLCELAARMRAALPHADWDAPRPSPQGEVPLHRALVYPVSDLALHSWDVYRSQGRRIELPDDLLTLCREVVESVPEAALRRPGGFGPAQPVPPDATPTARLMAFLGRSVD